MKEDSGFFGSKNIKCLTFGAAFDWICVVQFAKLAVSFYCQLKSSIVCVACPLVQRRPICSFQVTLMSPFLFCTLPASLCRSTRIEGVHTTPVFITVATIIHFFPLGCFQYIDLKFGRMVFHQHNIAIGNTVDAVVQLLFDKCAFYLVMGSFGIRL